MCDIGECTDPVLTKWTFKESQTPFTKRENKDVGRFRSWRRKQDGVFRPTQSFWSEVHKLRTNRAWSFQRDYVMHEVADTHNRASGRFVAFVVKKYIIFFFFKWLIISLDKNLISRLGSCRALCSCTNCNFDLQPGIKEFCLPLTSKNNLLTHFPKYLLLCFLKEYTFLNELSL